MTKVEMYGLAQCDTVKKARRWLDANGIDYAFHDYKKEGADPAKLEEWAEGVGWEALLNKRGTTFRKLSDEEKVDIDRGKALRLLAEHTSMIKRPVVELGDETVLVGFSQDEWAATLQ